jgi:hypothetical protein
MPDEKCDMTGGIFHGRTPGFLRRFEGGKQRDFLITMKKWDIVT